MWSSHEKRSGTQLDHNKRDIPVLDTVLFHSSLSSLPAKYLSDILTDKIYSIELWAKNIKKALINTLLVA